MMDNLTNLFISHNNIRRPVIVVITIIVVLIFAGIIVRPGVFSVQPIASIPDGMTIIYYSRSDNLPFFSSPDSICMQIQGSVSLLCRGIALSASKELINRTIIRLPYIEWTYLQSTGGEKFEK